MEPKEYFFMVASANNFRIAADIYDIIVLKIVPPIMPYADYLVEKAQEGWTYILTSVTPVIVQTLGEQAKKFLGMASSWLLSVLIFRAADPALQNSLNVPQPNRNALSFLGDKGCLLYTSPSPRDATLSRMPSSA
eukprot:TRINITY_DN4087_c0_g1_i3.p2 TRINITY_DN4087_c0_g1~~TRINITY_DN4087_c0_g1_i3.p2  ORF type:complete len:135 (+),score=30.33 TRINITY_DN4087_c0_g1_i3:314-718(+)